MAINVRVLSITVGCILAVDFIFYVVSNAVPSWAKVGSDGAEVTYGLWSVCSSVTGYGSGCAPITCSSSDSTGICSKLRAARAFVTLACITAPIAAVCLILSALTKDRLQQIVLNVGKGLAFVCLIMGIIGIAVGISAAADTVTGGQAGISWSLGAGSIVGIIAIIINLVSAILSLFILNKN